MKKDVFQKIVSLIHDHHSIELLNTLNSNQSTLVYKGVIRAKKEFLPDKLVVVKVDLSQLNDTSKHQVSMESDLLEWFNHENIVKLNSFSRIQLDKQKYVNFLVVEYIDGRPLPEIIQEAKYFDIKITEKEAIYTTLRIIDAIEHVHTRTQNGEPLNIIHGDISTDNVIISNDGKVKIIDFGVSRWSLFESKKDIFYGKKYYSSPELLRKDPELDQRTDIYSIGVVFLELLYGKKIKDLTVAFEDVSKKHRKELVRILKKALEHDKESRFKTASQFRQEIEAYIEKYKVILHSKCLKTLLSNLDLESQHAQTIQISDQTNFAPPPNTRKLNKQVLAYVFGGLSAIALYFGAPYLLENSPKTPETNTTDQSSEEKIVKEVAAVQPKLWSPVINLSSPEAHITLKIDNKVFEGSSSLYVDTLRFDNSVSEKEAVIEVNKAGFRDIEEKVLISKDKPEFTKEFVLKELTLGSVSISAKPWALVSIDKVFSYTEAPVSKSVKEGEYKLKASYEDIFGQKHYLSKKINVAGESKLSCLVSFEPKKYISCK